jgi:transcriptional regulator with XRE-family HTH domain
MAMPQINPAALAAIRQRTGLSQEALGRAAGVSQNRISELESRSMPVRPSTVARLATALQVPQTAITQLSDSELVEP